MTSYGAYDAGLPCKNSSCNSFGKSHPNCRCYGNMAEGGEADFCSSNRSHNPDCEYFADGGDSILPPIDPANVIPNTNKGSDYYSPFTPSVNPTEASLPPIDPSKIVLDKDSLPPIDPNNVIPDQNPYESTGNKIGTAVEGALSGVISKPAVIGYERILNAAGVPGTSDQDIAGRQAANPGISGASEAAGLIGGMFTGVGEAALASKAAPVLTSRIGSAALNGLISNGIIQGADEIGNAMLGQGDPNHPIAGALINAGAASLLGAVTGGIFGTASSALSQAAENKMGSAFRSWLIGAGAASKGVEIPESYLKSVGNQLPIDLNVPMYKAGAEFLKNSISNTSKGAALATGITAGSAIGGGIGGIAGAYAGEKLLAKPFGLVLNKVTAPLVTRIAASAEDNPGLIRNILRSIDYGNNINSGLQKATNAVSNLFKIGSQQVVNMSSLDKNREKLREYQDAGGINQNLEATQSLLNQQTPMPQGYAKGGLVKAIPEQELPKNTDVPSLIDEHDPVAKYFPEQNMLLNAAKSRISNYLMTQAPPKNQQKLVFDSEYQDPKLEKNYNMALDIANSPLSILQHIKDGTIEALHVKHFNAMYPEVNDLLQKKLTEKITEAQLKDEKPNHIIRQGLSLFMGTALSGEYQPQNIQAIQAVFQQQTPPPQQPQTKPKKSTSKLSKSDQSFLTNSQALASRQQKQ